jgi:hypothetical protein
MATTYVLISTVTVGSGGSATIAFSSIPQTYTDLSMFMSVRSTSGSNIGSVALNMSINGVTTNRSARRLYSPIGSDAPSTPRLGTAITTSTSTASAFSNIHVYFSNYAGSTFKSYSLDGFTPQASTSSYEGDYTSGLWSATSAITDMSFSVSDSSNFAEFSKAYLYGILNS